MAARPRLKWSSTRETPYDGAPMRSVRIVARSSATSYGSRDASLFGAVERLPEDGDWSWWRV